MRHYTCRLL
ncbi:hypothetical protein F383_01964 [Gossypium arboreum]|uniref:Uncharacterized protein n=1 Tax=Gossypium arboreum TaxID=29729 RepID=A0A0B0PEV6_GOSAR|nr:hypothetical protein F383_01964 [Gossypium arboreum]